MFNGSSLSLTSLLVADAADPCVGLGGHLRGLPTLNPSSSASTNSFLCTPLFSQKHKHSYFLFQTHVPARFPLHGSVYRRIHGGLKGSAQFAHLKSFPGCWSSKLHQILYFFFNREEIKKLQKIFFLGISLLGTFTNKNENFGQRAGYPLQS